jgi:hypothetical protein
LHIQTHIDLEKITRPEWIPRGKSVALDPRTEGDLREEFWRVVQARVLRQEEEGHQHLSSTTTISPGGSHELMQC